MHILHSAGSIHMFHDMAQTHPPSQAHALFCGVGGTCALVRLPPPHIFSLFEVRGEGPQETTWPPFSTSLLLHGLTALTLQACHLALVPCMKMKDV